MSDIKLIVWETQVVNGENSKGSFFSCDPKAETVSQAIEIRQNWIDIVNRDHPQRKGGVVLINGVYSV